MREGKFGAGVVMEHGTQVKGIITERDFISKVFGQSVRLGDMRVGDIMTRDPHYLLDHHKVAYAYNNMMKFGYRNMLVLNDDKFPIAVITLLDLLNYLFRKLNP